MSPYFALLQLDRFPGPFHRGKFRDAFKLEFAALDPQNRNASSHGVGVVPDMDIYVTLAIDTYSARLRWAFDRGDRFKRAVVVFVKDGPRGTLIELTRAEITDVTMERMDMGFNTPNGDPTMSVTLHGTKAGSH